MHRFRTIFPNRHVVLPVIHVTDLKQALSNTQIATEAGVDGVFLINHCSNHRELFDVHAGVTAGFPDLWVGVNCLDLSPPEVFARVPQGLAGVWVDNAMIDEESQMQPDAEVVQAAQGLSGWQGLYFGGVAFKGQRAVANLAAAARSASRYMDVVTTSGPGTGRAAAPDKIRIMKEAIGEHPLALASAVTPENVGDYLPFADCFLVATGISRTFYELEPAKVRALMDRVRSFITA